MNEPVEFHRAQASRSKMRSLLGLAMLGVFLLAGAGVTILSVGSGRPRTEQIVIMMVLFGLAMIGGLVAALGIDASRRHGVAAALVALGLEVDADPSKERRTELFAPFTGVRALRHGAKGLRLAASGDVDGDTIHLIEHRYTIHAGNSHRVVRHTVAAMACPPSWPALNLTGQNLITGWWANLRGRDFKLENEAFNERWIVKTENEDFALVFLSPQVQEFLASGPKGETWQIGNGWVYWFRQKPLKVEDVRQPIDRLLGLGRVLPPELVHWQG